MSIDDAGGSGVRTAALARLAELTGPGGARSIPEVLDRLAAIRDEAGAASGRGEDDGIAAFTGFCHVVTATVDELRTSGTFAAPEFVVRLDLEIAERYFAALRRYAVDARTAPLAWRVLFDRRDDPAVPAARFAVAGANAQLNLDLAGALVSTWERVGPDDGAADSPQYRDYCLLNEVCEATLDPLCERLAQHSTDPTAVHLSDLVVRFTRDLAWDEAREVWTDGADEQRRRASDGKLDAIAGFLGARLLGPLPPT
jgi:Family of unknown function (DUF5995)